MRTDNPGGPADVVYGLVLLECGFTLLAMLGEILFMGGNPLYLVMPIAKSAALLLFATKLLRGRRWAAVALIIAHALTLIGFWLNLLLALLPTLTFSINLVGLLTGVALPVGVIWLCVSLLSGPRLIRLPMMAAVPMMPAPMTPAAPMMVAPAMPAVPIALAVPRPPVWYPPIPPAHPDSSAVATLPIRLAGHYPSPDAPQPGVDR
jgi:hypothetical protein